MQTTNLSTNDKLKHSLFYAISMAVAFLLLALIFHFGPQTQTATTVAISSVGWWETIQGELSKNLNVPITRLIVQILVILVFSRICSAVLKFLNQPQVIGEMLAGILLGKSVFAFVWPSGFDFVFPSSSMPSLFILSQVGLILFMFVVGLNLKVAEVKSRAGAAVIISHVSIVVPFLLGSVTALLLYETYGPTQFDFLSFALFMGIAMSITAFPVLARILQEKKLTETPLGAMALTCAAVDDVTAWCVLAAVVGIVKAGSFAVAVGALLAAIIFVSAMFKFVKPFVARVLEPTLKSGELNRLQLGFLVSVLLCSAVVAEVIGIHALFGAFLAGTIMPQNISLRASLIAKIEDITAVVFLPIFFAYTGLRTQIGLLNGWQDWAVCLGIIFVAVLGKMGGSSLAARWAGMGWRESFAIGSLMNTRGLMELVVLNIGYDIGILSPTLFAMLVVMALATTAMTSPLLSVFVPKMVR